MNPGLLEKQEAYAVPKLGTGGKSQQHLTLHGEGTSRPQPPKSAVATYIPGAELPSGVARIVETVKLLFQVGKLSSAALTERPAAWKPQEQCKQWALTQQTHMYAQRKMPEPAEKP